MTKSATRLSKPSKMGEDDLVGLLGASFFRRDGLATALRLFDWLGKNRAGFDVVAATESFARADKTKLMEAAASALIAGGASIDWYGREFWQLASCDETNGYVSDWDSNEAASATQWGGMKGRVVFLEETARPGLLEGLTEYLTKSKFWSGALGTPPESFADLWLELATKKENSGVVSFEKVPNFAWTYKSDPLSRVKMMAVFGTDDAFDEIRRLIANEDDVRLVMRMERTLMSAGGVPDATDAPFEGSYSENAAMTWTSERFLNKDAAYRMKKVSAQAIESAFALLPEFVSNRSKALDGESECSYVSVKDRKTGGAKRVFKISIRTHSEKSRDEARNLLKVLPKGLLILLTSKNEELIGFGFEEFERELSHSMDCLVLKGSLESKLGSSRTSVSTKAKL